MDPFCDCDSCPMVFKYLRVFTCRFPTYCGMEHCILRLKERKRTWRPAHGRRSATAIGSVVLATGWGGIIWLEKWSAKVKS